jgi:hypothetical protein
MNARQLAEYLTWTHDQKIRHGTMLPGKYHYKTIEQVVLQCGFVFDKIDNSWPVKKGKMKACYLNSFKMVEDDPSLIYCEGFATSHGALKGSFPVMHAWTIDQNGVVLDPTWSDGQTYLGVPFDWEFLIQSVVSYNQISLLDNPDNAWPVMQLYPRQFVDKRWVERLMDRGDILGFQRAKGVV